MTGSTAWLLEMREPTGAVWTGEVREQTGHAWQEGSRAPGSSGAAGRAGVTAALTPRWHGAAPGEEWRPCLIPQRNTLAPPDRSCGS